MKKVIFYILIFIAVSQLCYSQDFSDIKGFTPSLPVQEAEYYKKSNIYQQDFLYLCAALDSFHANVYMNFPKEKFEKEKENILSRLAACTNDTLLFQLAQSFTNKIKDAHTGIGFSIIPGKSYPFRCKYLTDSLCILMVTDQLQENLQGEMIKSINGIDIKEIEQRTSNIQPSENYVSLQNIITMNISNSGFLKTIDIVKTENDKITVLTYSGKEFQTLPNSSNNWRIKFPKHPVTDKGPENFSYKIINDKNLCYIQFNSFWDRRTSIERQELIPWFLRWYYKTARFFGGQGGVPEQNFEEFLDKCLADIEQNKVRKVIVDMRFNTGGNSTLGDQLLYALGVDKFKNHTSDIKFSELHRTQYNFDRDAYYEKLKTFKLSDEPDIKDLSSDEKLQKTSRRFKGDVYFVTSEHTFSSAVLLATIVKDNKLFKVVGEPIRERPSHFGDVLLLRLPNTQRPCHLSYKLWHRPDRSKDSEETLYPDVPIYKTYKSIIDGIDPVYEWVIAQP